MATLRPIGKSPVKIANELVEVLHNHQCSVWDAEQILSTALQIIRVNATVPPAGTVPYDLPPKVNL